MDAKELSFSVTKYPLHGTIKPLRVEQLDDETKCRLVERHVSDGRVSGTELLQRVCDIDRWTADRLDIKDTAVDNLTLRMVYADESNTGIDQDRTVDPNSFIALSYCWHQPTWMPARGLMYDPLHWEHTHLDPDFPLLHPMWAAFLYQRSGSTEPVWIDQRCINQEDEKEKLHAVGAMDLIYASARQVVVALEDVRLDEQNLNTLLDYMDYIEKTLSAASTELGYGTTMEICVWHDEKQIALSAAMSRIFASRWFTRAWCAHELWTGRSHVFLAPITVGDLSTSPSLAPVSIVRFNASSLSIAHHSVSQWRLRGSLNSSASGMAYHLLSQLLSVGNPESCLAILQPTQSSEQALTFALQFSNSSDGSNRPPHLNTFAMIARLSARETFDKKWPLP